MSPVFIVVALALVLRGAGALALAPLDSWMEATRWATGVTFIVMGGAHFTRLGRHVERLVPPAVPRAALVVRVLGVWQIAGGTGLVFGPARHTAAFALVVLLLLKLPANLRAASASLRLPGRFATAPSWRVPAQALWIALVWWSGS